MLRAKRIRLAKSRLRPNGENMACVTRNLVLAASIALALAACGKKGDLQRPPPPPDVPKDSKGQPAPDRPFILDPLLR
jgi:predicted small lipoprotein YifL